MVFGQSHRARLERGRGGAEDLTEMPGLRGPAAENLLDHFDGNEDLAGEGVADALLGNQTGVVAQIVQGAENVVVMADEVVGELVDQGEPAMSLSVSAMLSRGDTMEPAAGSVPDAVEQAAPVGNDQALAKLPIVLLTRRYAVRSCQVHARSSGSSPRTGSTQRWADEPATSRTAASCLVRVTPTQERGSAETCRRPQLCGTEGTLVPAGGRWRVWYRQHERDNWPASVWRHDRFSFRQAHALASAGGGRGIETRSWLRRPPADHELAMWT